MQPHGALDARGLRWYTQRDDVQSISSRAGWWRDLVGAARSARAALRPRRRRSGSSSTTGPTSSARHHRQVREADRHQGDLRCLRLRGNHGCAAPGGRLGLRCGDRLDRLSSAGRSRRACTRRWTSRKLPNWKNLDPRILAIQSAYDPGNAHAVPYLHSINGFAYNVDMIKARMPNAPVDSLDMLFKPEIVSKFADCGVTFLDSAEDVIQLALQLSGARSQLPPSPRTSRRPRICCSRCAPTSAPSIPPNT